MLPSDYCVYQGGVIPPRALSVVLRDARIADGFTYCILPAVRYTTASCCVTVKLKQKSVLVLTAPKRDILRQPDATAEVLGFSNASFFLLWQIIVIDEFKWEECLLLVVQQTNA